MKIGGMNYIRNRCDLYQKIQLDDTANAKSMNKGVFKMKRHVKKLTTSNRLNFKLASGTHGLRSELSRRDNGKHTKKLLKGIDIDIKTSLSEYKKNRWRPFCATYESKAEAESYSQDFELYVRKELEKFKWEVVHMYDESLYSEFSLEEVACAIKSLKHHKASPNTLTHSSLVITFIISTTTTTSALSYNNANSLIKIHGLTLFPTFNSLKSKIQ
eukprot:Awhi_evm1s10367